MNSNFYNRSFQLFSLFLITVVLISCGHNKPTYPGPLSAKESMETFYFAEDFKAQLFAGDSLLQDPITMVFGGDGNVYVVGMQNVNLEDVKEVVKPRGHILILKDTDGDGKADQSTVFADSLHYPSSVLLWKGGLIVTAAPKILYLKDTNGDGKADKREVLFSGFFTGNEEAQITSLQFNVDNWIYANNDGMSSKITFHRKPNVPKLSLQGFDLRFRLDSNQFERTTGPGQFGQAFDDWGHRFFTKNSLHIQQVVIPARYLLRNPYMPPSAKRAVKNISNHDPAMFQMTRAPYWRRVRTRRRNKKYKKHNLHNVEFAKSNFTGASGGTYYGGDELGEKFYGSIFTGEVAGNLVHRDVLVPSDNGPFFVAKRGNKEQNQEFMASTDSWFRPASFAVGPTGYLYVIDMYRQHIETPLSIPEDLQKNMNFANGMKQGRIYRILPEDSVYSKEMSFNLMDKKSETLVKYLTKDTRWWRRHAHKILVARQDKSVIPAVKTLFLNSNDPRVRIEALYVLEGLNTLNAKIVKQAMKDSEVGVRENGAILSERFPELLPQLKEMVNDSSLRVAFQAVLSLGEFTEQPVVSILADAVVQYGQNPWFRTAVLSSRAGSSVDLLKVLVRESSFFRDITSWKQTFLENISYTIGNRNKQVVALLDLLSRSPLTQNEKAQFASLKGLVNGLLKSKQTGSALKESLQSIKKKVNTDAKGAIEDLKELYRSSQ